MDSTPGVVVAWPGVVVVAAVVVVVGATVVEVVAAGGLSLLQAAPSPARASPRVRSNERRIASR